LDLQKKSLGASERNEEERSAWRDRLKDIDPTRLVFVDECGTNITLTTLYARAPSGERAFGKAPRNWDKNVTLIAALSAEGMGQAMSVEGATDGAAFEAYVKHFLLPTLKEGQVVVMDKASKPTRALGCASSSRVREPASCSYQPTHLISHRLKKPSRRSQGHLAQDRGLHAGGFDRSDRSSARCGQP
jgi:transposase